MVSQTRSGVIPQQVDSNKSTQGQGSNRMRTGDKQHPNSAKLYTHKGRLHNKQKPITGKVTAIPYVGKGIGSKGPLNDINPAGRMDLT